MANSVLVYGKSKSGKSTSMETLDPATTFIINIANKPLPFKSWKSKYTPFNSKEKTGNIVSTSDPKIIIAVLEIIDKYMPHINCVVIDDYQYMSAFEYMNRSEETGYQKFNIIGKAIFLTATKPETMRSDLVVIFTNHEEDVTDKEGDVTIKAKTVGRLIDTFLTLEGLFTVVLRATVKRSKEGSRHVFETQNIGNTTAGSPKGMFDTFEIPNDLEIVRKAILSYEE